jgi:hypothetical protein
MNFEWIITMIGNEETVWQNNLRKITFVIEEESDREFKWSIAVDIFGDRVDMMKDFKVWDKVNAALNSRAREYNGRRFNSISAWRLEKANWSSSSNSNNDNDLPF